MSALESVVLETVTAMGSPFYPNNSFNFAILSANGQIDDATYAEEMSLVSPRACQRKRQEFRRGRAAAHLALKKIGFEDPPPVLRGKHGEPSWPMGVTGSITHCYPWSIAVAARRQNRFVIGVDLESTGRAGKTDISSLVCCDNELGWIRNGGCDFQERLSMIFSAKEAVYKAFCPLYQRYIDFKEVELQWLPEQHRFQGKFLFDSALAPGYSFHIHCRRYRDLVFSFLMRQLA